MSDARLTIICGDALSELRKLPNESVQCCVTSPPFYGLRDYGTTPQIWDGREDCRHEWEQHVQPAANGIIHDGGMTGKTLSGNSGNSGNWGTRKPKKSDFCLKCGAWRPTPELYVQHCVSVFLEVRRVLRKDGTLWINLGDSYASGKGTCFNPGGGTTSLGKERKDAAAHPLNRGNKSTLAKSGLKPKDLIGIPWRVAFALQSVGWWLRSDIIWNKANCMPESILDRPTRSHEYLFLLTKADRYFYDAEAIKEPASEADWESRIGRANLNNKLLPTAEINGILPRVKYTPNKKDKQEKSEQCSGMRNKRDVWTVAPANYPEAHFATFPAPLISPCILAGSRVGDTILDPFGGSGTTGMVALELGRKAILIELNPKYVDLIKRRCDVTPGLALA